MPGTVDSCDQADLVSAILTYRHWIAPFHERSTMGNKPHLHPHQRQRRTSRTTRLLVAIFILAILALGIALSATGRIPAGWRWF